LHSYNYTKNCPTRKGSGENQKEEGTSRDNTLQKRALLEPKSSGARQKLLNLRHLGGEGPKA